jgi:hypothetical protein
MRALSTYRLLSTSKGGFIMIRYYTIALAALLTAAVPSLSAQDIQRSYDVVIANGRAMDPESRLDAVRHIGIDGGKIAAISPTPLAGDVEIDATGHVIAPGFIDIHNHSPTPLGFAYQAQDGVTTSLDLEIGSFPINAYGSLIRDRAILNYGASAGYMQARMAAMSDYRQTHLVDSPRKVSNEGKSARRAMTAQASPEELIQIETNLTLALNNGAIGIGVPLDYMSIAVSEEELNMPFALAADFDAPLFVHIRRGIAGDPTGLDEVLRLAKKFGTSVLICHLSHSAMQNTELFLQKIRAARADGVDVSTEVLPYNAGSTSIGAAVFGRDWRSIFNIDYGDVQRASTGEFFTKESFERTRREEPGADIIHHYVKEKWTRFLVEAPDVIVSSDGLVVSTLDKNIPPQGVGSFSKLIGKYVRDEKTLDLMTALSKITLLPAQLLEKSAPTFRLKGRLQIGMDADITVFDLATIAAKTTYEQPHNASVGVQTLLVGGQIVIENGEILGDAFPGQHVLATPRRE